MPGVKVHDRLSKLVGSSGSGSACSAAIVVSTATTATATATGCQSSGTSGNYYRVNWSQGTTEGGSSGSALFKGGSQVIGTLYGGSSSCTATTSPEFYGRFDVAFNAAMKSWLSPSTGQSPVVSTGNRVPVYRFYNGTTGAHFFTASPAERDNTLQNFPVFAYEGVAFYAQAVTLTGNSPVYRFYGSKGGAHFYTISAAERDAVVASNSDFKYEGVAWFASTSAAAGGTPLYRFYQPAKGVHFYTISSAERDYIIANSPSYRYEGIGYYAWTGL